VTGKSETIEFGFVGEPAKVNIEILDTIIHSDAIPVIAPIGVGEDGETYNVNADTAAGAIATAMKAKRLLLLTDVAGVLDKDKQLISELLIGDVPTLIANGTITGGMIPKLQTCVAALDNGVALLHPRRPMPTILAEAVLALGITPGGIPFGSGGSLTDIFFLICSTSDHEHLRLLARLSRVINDADFLWAMRAAPSAAALHRLIEGREATIRGANG